MRYKYSKQTNNHTKNLIMKNKNMLHLMAILMITIANLSIISCSSSDDDGIDSPLVGQWESTQNSGEKFIFNRNGSCIKQYIAPDSKGVTDIVTDGSLAEQYFYGMWEVSGTQLSITWTSQKTVKLENDKPVTESETYPIKKVESGTFSISDDNIVIQLGDGVSYTTWRGIRTK